MIEEYPVKFQRLLKQDPFMDLDSLHDAIVELESRPPGGIESLSGFLCGRAQLREIDQSRQRRRFLADSGEAIRGQLSKEKDPLEYLEELELREAVNELMERLPQDQREILQLVYVDEVLQTEIAAKHNCAPQSVNTRLSRAKEYLKHLLTQRMHGKEFQ